MRPLFALDKHRATATASDADGHNADGPVDPVIQDIAKETNISPGQVLLKWAQQIGDIIVTTSSKESRMKEQLAVPSLPDLTAEQLKAITDAGAKKSSQRKYMLEVFTK